LLPRAAAYHDGALLVACQGNDTLVEYDARAIDPARTERRRWRLPAGPDGVAVDSLQGRAVVHARFDHRLAVVPLGGGAAREIELTRPARPALTAAQEAGRRLFHAAHDERISADGRACASCHPDGREDALTWSTPDGPRQTLMLTGRLPESGPYGWSGASTSVDDHVQQTFTRLGGHGLPDDARSALVGYISTLGAPRAGRPTVWAQRQQALVERGRALFTSAEASCATCHPGGLSDGQSHAVAVRARADQSDRLDTPSLRFLGQSAPYFHDGRYATLGQMLEAADHHMGQSLQLEVSDRRALLAYLETL
ncbi:MAG: c-type cytochrome, partial [Myxococcales bacterium]